MKTLSIVLIWMCLFIVVMLIGICRSLSGTETLDAVVYVWLWFNLLICILEIVMLSHRCRLASLAQQSWWSQDIPLTSSLTTNFWLGGWAEYTHLDTRYQDVSSYVHLFELINVVFTLIPSLIILINFRRLTSSYLRLAWFISLIQLVTTSVYYLTLIPEIHRVNSQTGIYALFNLPWIVMPIVTMIWASRRLSNISP